MEDALIDSVHLGDINGIPSFLFVTRHTDQLKRLFTLFPVSILTMDVPTMRGMPLSPDIVLPDDASLRIEFSLDDVQPDDLLWEMYIPAEKRWQMLALNLKSRSLNIGIRDSASGKVLPIPGRQTPHIMDWSGVSGLVRAIQAANTRQGGSGWRKENAHNIIEGMEDVINRYGGYVTGLHANMGLVYRELGELDKAKPCYMREIRGAQRKDGSFARSAMLGFNNLAVVYKKEGAFDKSVQCFQLALALNPNYFEALISIAGLIPDIKQSTAYLGRAYRLQPESPIWGLLLHNMAEAHQLTPERVYDLVYEQAEEASLETALFDKAILKQIKLM